MGFTEAEYGRSRQFLYHLTAGKNVRLIKRTGLLQSATELLSQAAERKLETSRRTECLTITVDGESVVICDQLPLREANILLEGGWTFADLRLCLDGQVFFWSGRESGPVRYGISHFERYASTNPSVLRMPFDSLLGSNQGNRPKFCKYNSGAPRHYFGRPSPRGPRTFLFADECDFLPGNVAEVVFLQSVRLPDDTELAESPEGPWRPLWR